MIEKISNSISAFAITLIYLGYCNLDFYFRNFNIDITKYATSAEILLSFIPVINIILLAIIFSFIFLKLISAMLSFEIYLFRKFDSFPIEKIKDSHLSFKKEIWKNLSFGKKYNACFYFILSEKGIRIIASLSLLLLAFTYRPVEVWRYGNYSILSTYHIICFSLIIIAVFEIIKVFNFKKLETKIMGVKLFSIIILTGWLISLLFVLNNGKSDFIKIGRTLKNVEFEYNQKHVQTDSNVLYLGEVQEYLFLYNIKDEETFVYSKNAITNIKIGDKSNFAEIKKRYSTLEK